jgi:hypothetical protein
VRVLKGYTPKRGALPHPTQQRFPCSNGVSMTGDPKAAESRQLSITQHSWCLTGPRRCLASLPLSPPPPPVDQGRGLTIPMRLPKAPARLLQAVSVTTLLRWAKLEVSPVHASTPPRDNVREEFFGSDSHSEENPAAHTSQMT